MKTLALLVLSLFYFSSNTMAHDFVQVKNGRLEKSGKPYLFMGTNFWQAMNLGTSNKKLLKRELDHLQFLGVKQLRILGLSEGPDTEPYRVVPAVQINPTTQNEELLKGLDFLLVEMKKRGMTAVVFLSNFWPWSGGFAQWVSWTEGSSIPYPPPHPGGNWGTFQEYSSRFYTLPKAVEAQQKSIAKIVSRVNSITKIPYTEDSIIMSWQLANEPRGGKYRKEFLAWASSTAKLIKKLDRNHMVSLGSEGNTLSPESAGNNFIEDHSIPEIDYATIHVWVENWGVYDPKDPAKTFPTAIETLKTYIEDHVTKSKAFNKPIILEEFGMARDARSMDPRTSTEYRDNYYQVAFQETLRFMKMNGIISGVNFWAWSGESRPSKPYGSIWKPGDKLLGDPPHEEQGWYGVYGSDKSTLKIIMNSAWSVKNLRK
jgi:mannan endo-1,4-beta-mannosidase